MLDKLLWLLDRPQQSLFQGVQKGRQSFEDAAHEPGASIPWAALASLPAAAEGAYEGLVGSGQDVSGQDLTQGFNEQFGGERPQGVSEADWQKSQQDMDNLLGSILNLTASPADVAMPAGRLLRSEPVKAAYALNKMAPEYSSLMKATMGTPLSKAKEALGGILGGAQELAGQMQPAMVGAMADIGPEVANKYQPWINRLNRDLLGAYGLRYHTAPTDVKSATPLVFSEAASDVSNLKNVLSRRQEAAPGVKGFYANLWDMGKEGQLVGLARDRPLPAVKKTLVHEGGQHGLTNMLTSQNMPNETFDTAYGYLRNNLPKTGGLPGGQEIGEAIAGLPQKMPEIADMLRDVSAYARLEKKNPIGFGDEIMARISAQQPVGIFGYPTRKAAERAGVMDDPLISALAKTAEEMPWVNPHFSWGGYRDLERAPTQLVAQGRRAVQDENIQPDLSWLWSGGE